MAEGMKIGAGHVDISADMTNLDNALGALPAKVGRQLEATMQTMQAAIARNKLEFKMLGPDDGSAAWKQLADELTAAQNKLKASLDRVKQAAVNKATGLAAAAQAAQKMAAADAEAARAAAIAEAAHVKAAKNQAAAMKAAAADQATSHRKIQDEAGASGHRMAVFAQTLDDLQYVPEQGLRPILNNLIQISPVLGIVGLAIQQVISHWDMFASKADTSKNAVESLANEMERLGDLTAITATQSERYQAIQANKGRADSLTGASTESDQARLKAASDVTARLGGDWVISQLAQDPAIRAKAEKLALKEVGADAESGMFANTKQAMFGKGVDPGRVEELARLEARNKLGEMAGSDEGIAQLGKIIPEFNAALSESIAAVKAKAEADRFDEHADETRRGLEKRARDEAAREAAQVDAKLDAQRRSEAEWKKQDEIKAIQDQQEALRERIAKAKARPDTAFMGIDEYLKGIQKTVDRPGENSLAKQQADSLKALEKNAKEQLEEMKRQHATEARLG